MNNDTRKGFVVYQSLSFTMIKELLENESTPSWIKIWLYLSILQKYHKTLYPKNQYISKKLNIPLGTVKYALGKLKEEGYIEIINPKSWKRQIKLTHIANITDSDYKDVKDKNELAYHTLYNRQLYRDCIYLVDTEYMAIQDRLKDDKELDFYLTGINNYLSTSTIKYDSHFKMIWTWIDKNESQIKNKKKKYDTPNYQWFIEYERGYIKQDTKELKEVFDYDWLNDYIDDYDEEE